MMAHPFITLGLAFGMMTALWPLSIRLRDVSIVDILWAPAFAVLAWSYVFRRAAAWRARLDRAGADHGLGVAPGQSYLARWRRLGHEDYRYAEIRRRNGANFPLTSLVWIFWLQACCSG